MKRLMLAIGMLLVLVALGVAAWYFVSPLLLPLLPDDTVDEALPTPVAVGFLASQAKTMSQFPADNEIGVIMPPTVAISEETPVAAITPTIASEMPVNAPSIFGQGQFVDGDRFHMGSGVATLYKTPDDSFLLQLDDFAVTNGPELHVLLSPNATPTDHASLGDYLDLGVLKDTIGDQNYPFSADFDPTRYKSVVIYCLPFKVIFAIASLE